jgi:sulfite reductase (ferredoxin)
VPRDRLVATLVPLLEGFREGRRPGECFGDYCQRLGPDRARQLAGANSH